MSDTTAPADTPSENQQVLADATQNRDPVIANDAAAQNAPGVALTDEQIEAMDTADLKTELRQRDLSVSGNKAELAARLREAQPKAVESGGAQVTAGEQTKRAAETGGQITEPGKTEEEQGEELVHTGETTGGLVKTAQREQHTDLLQQMSAERRKAQHDAANRY